MSDNITLPREVVEGALEALDSEHPDIQLRAAIALRTALAAEQTKPEPVADEEAPRLWAWIREGWSADCGPWYEVIRNDQMTWRDRKGWTPLYTALAAEQPSEEAEALRRDAERYRLLRRGQHWSVVNGIGDALRAEELDALFDAAMQEDKT